MYRHFVSSFVVAALAFYGLPAAGQDSNALSKKTSAIGDAFQSLFNPSSAPKVRSMGSIQRTNFLDELLASPGQLQVAFVIDGTESMGNQLTGVQKQLSTLLADLRRVVGNGLAVQIIVYRDVAAASGPISWPLPIGHQSWATEDKDIVSGLEKLTPESGAPYFYEQVDVGLYTALNELNWSEANDVSRWIFLIGDAPPFKSGFQELENKASRQYDSELLKRTAQQKNINIHALICPSREEDRAIHESVLAECRDFFTDMAGATGGLVLDLSDPSELRRIRQAAEEASKNFVSFKPITQADLDTFTLATKPAPRVRVAVLPFLEIRQMNFDSSNPMTQLAEEVRSQLDQKGIETRPLHKVQEKFEQAASRRRREPIPESGIPQFVGENLNVEYVIWRHPVPSPGSGFQAEVLNVRTGKAETVSDVIELKSNIANNMSPVNVRLCSLIMQSLATKSKTANQTASRVFTDGKFQTRLVSLSENGAEKLQRARLYLQRSQRYSAMDDAAEDLKKAEQELLSIEQDESSNSLWNNLLANVYFNLAQQEKARSKSSDAANHLRLAKKYAEFAAKRDSNKEFQADHMFLQRQFDKALPAYESIVQTSLSPDTISRAQWMLTFMYLGDWGVSAAGLQNLDQSRKHAIALLASYPESKEAEALKLALRWSDSEQRTMLAVLPIEDPSPSDGGQ